MIAEQAAHSAWMLGSSRLELLGKIKMCLESHENAGLGKETRS